MGKQQLSREHVKEDLKRKKAQIAELQKQIEEVRKSTQVTVEDLMDALIELSTFLDSTLYPKGGIVLVRDHTDTDEYDPAIAVLSKIKLSINKKISSNKLGLCVCMDGLYNFSDYLTHPGSEFFEGKVTLESVNIRFDQIKDTAESAVRDLIYKIGDWTIEDYTVVYFVPDVTEIDLYRNFKEIKINGSGPYKTKDVFGKNSD